MKKIYLDSCIFIYYLEAHRDFGERALRLFRSAERGELKIIASALVLHEIMAGLQAENESLKDEIHSLLVTHPGVEWVNFDLDLANLSASLRSELRWKAPDAIHLATAIRYQCNKFYTEDKSLKVKGLDLPIEILGLG